MSSTPRRGLYIHVPFCATRCGYCDFNTYTPAELASAGSGSAGTPGNTIPGYLRALTRELELAAESWDVPHVDTVFFGGGTPSMLGHAGLSRALGAVRQTVGLAPDAEVTTEANPESTDPEFFAELRAAGFTRVSLGMQSAAGHVLKVLDRRHTPGRAVAAAREAQRAGFDHVNLDLIYGTPTETDADLQASLDAALEAGVDHISAYSLIVEDGTAMARKVRRGELPAPDEDTLADRYRMVDRALSQAGFTWYEVSNWARPGGQCEHNLVYWRSGQWWGAGPGAHGCVHLTPAALDTRGLTPPDSGLTRMVNAKHPARYYESLITEGQPPVTLYEPLSEQDLATERIMLGLRLREGIEWRLVAEAASTIEKWMDHGLLRRDADRVSLTEAGRYLADGIVADILFALD
ncbi:coproporphyrinogen III oxidase [Corynebacterium heidelbergense]|uniref:Heme chaperone HemW n=1 Tax=Corynebacterium heidelbergense TaxID=2055947 RepID=A0A364V914_9CORY|nr:coproporphyrinogen III oxidase [Corynebacterium heidelbergense]